MKRSPELAALSRDHHQALEAALRLRRATDGTVEEAIEHFLAFWSRQGEHHFATEERLVLPALPDNDAEWAEATRRVREDHAEIRTRAAALPHRPSVDAARRLGELLGAHVRFEERTLFPLAEQRLSRVALADLGRALTSAEAAD
jgi:hemerythrin-like domain-containing protein